jgi:hypothetical protein
MTVERALRLIGGSFVALSVVLGIYSSPWFFAFTLFVAANLVQSAFTNWCPMMTLLRWMGLGECPAAKHSLPGGAGRPSIAGRS